MTIDTIQLKRQAAAYAADLVQSGMTVGLGHGSTPSMPWQSWRTN
jgi:ribose 5-phosphate isomerase